MAKIEVFTKFLCPYCSRAKMLLDRKGVNYQEIDLTTDRAGFDAMVERAGGRGRRLARAGAAASLAALVAGLQPGGAGRRRTHAADRGIARP